MTWLVVRLTWVLGAWQSYTEHYKLAVSRDLGHATWGIIFLYGVLTKLWGHDLRGGVIHDVARISPDFAADTVARFKIFDPA